MCRTNCYIPTGTGDFAGGRVTAPGAEVSSHITATEFEKDMTAEEWATFKREYPKLSQYAPK